MSRKYIVAANSATWDKKKGDTLELDLAAPEEQDLVASVRLEIAPRPYKVVGDVFKVFDKAKGESFEAALTKDQEAALLAGGQAELVEDAKPAPKPAPKRQPKGAKK